MSDTTMQHPVAEFLKTVVRARQVFDSTHTSNHADWMYRTYEEAVLTMGKPYEGALRPRGMFQRTPKQCFSNTYKLVDRHPEFTYVEGYAVTHDSPLPVQHAWAVDQHGRVVDLTWKAPERALYYGVEIPFETVRILAVKHGVYGVICNDWMVGVPLLKHGRFLPEKDA
jgi:hypothetical protein